MQANGKQNNPGYLHGGETSQDGTENDDVLGGFLTDDTLIGMGGNDVLRGDTDTQSHNNINNSFEFHDDFNQGGWGLYTEVGGWKRPDGSPLIEVQQSGTVGSASDGNAVLELDSTANSTVYRDLTDLDPTMSFELSFDWSPRPGVSEASNGMEVYWDGVLIFSTSAEGRGLSDFDWRTVTINVPVTDTEGRLEFRGTGISDSLGVTIDNVALTGTLPTFAPATDGGDDLLIGGAGDDVLEGGAGNDVLIGGEGADTIDGGTGDRDTVSFKESEGRIYVNLRTGIGKWNDAAGDTYENVEFVHGSRFNDRIIGDGNVNRLVGHDGDDRLSAGGGNDILLGGAGADQLDGGRGEADVADYTWSTTGVDVNLETGVGSGGHAEGDTLRRIENLVGSFYDDKLTGDDNVNRLTGHQGNDSLFGGGGNDILVGGLGADHHDGGSGDRDAADYGEAASGVGVDLESGGFAGEANGDTYAGIEFVYGSDHDDEIRGDAAKNRLVGGDGDDRLFGGDGDDYLVGGEGADHLDGGDGTRDTVEYRDAGSGVGLDLLTGGFAGDAAGDTFAGIEYVYGSDHADDITGNAEANRLIGFMGDDEINGAAGNDYIIGMAGNDRLTGGDGDDVFLYKAAFGDDVITDFEAGAGRTDRIWIDIGSTQFSDLVISDTVNGALIDVAGYGTILLEGVLSTDLAADDFIF